MRSVWSLMLAVLFAVGCSKKDNSAPAPAPAGTQGAPTLPAVPAGNPAAMPASETLSGKVAEVLEVPSYTYLRLTTASGDVWVAVPTTQVAVGTTVSVKNPMRMDGFESKSLNRKFDVIMFGAGIETPGRATASLGSAPAAPVPPAPVVDITDVKVDKAPGPDAKTIAEIYAQRSAIKDKPVTVRGKVVKYSAGILGRNWVHLRDGSGTEQAKDNDLTLTTSDTTAPGEVVVAKGVVHLDKDLGSGYSYPVIIEDATLAK